ncbi:ImmA/IrrE family metallo-endopeptidase [Cellulosimicrobium funkei]|uniref:ImmA/IrrE family metallo-endopeptidase n=1 Tax=Cellulosimicrobium funkei TaxID=264251 RepID=UPI003435830B
MARYSPWRDAAARYPDVQIERCDIAPVRGAWVQEVSMILIDRSLNRTQRDSTLAHELAHIDLRHHEHTPPDRWFAARFELEADTLAARRLLDDIDDVAEAMALHPQDLASAAEYLEVTPGVLMRRIATLTRAEQAIIVDRLERLDRSC